MSPTINSPLLLLVIGIAAAMSSIFQRPLEHDFKVPEILPRRTLPDEFRGQRYLDDEEVVLSALIDPSTGSIPRLVDFMVFLTRLETVAVVWPSILWFLSFPMFL